MSSSEDPPSTLDSSHSHSNGHPLPTPDPSPDSSPTSTLPHTAPAPADVAPTEARGLHAHRKPSMILTHPASLTIPASGASPSASPDVGAFPVSSSFTGDPRASGSPPQSPNPQPMSPLPMPTAPPPPSRSASHRLVDYFLVIGRQPPATQSLVPMRRLSRSNSQTIQPISDVSITTVKEATPDLSQDWTRLTDFEGVEQNLNPGFMRTPVYITESRIPKKGSGGGDKGLATLMHPITGLDVVYVDKKEAPKAGFQQLTGSVSRGSFKGSVALCVERDNKKSPIIDIKIIAVNSKDSKDGKDKAAADKDKAAEKDKTNAGDGAAADLCPSDYTLIDKVITSHKGKDYYLCYKVAVRRAVEYMAYEAFVLDRYPPTDHADQPLEAQGVAMLCFPRGMILGADMSMPSFMTFVITQADGSEMYGAALIFYELVTDLTDVPALYPMPGSKAGNGLLTPPRARGPGEEQQTFLNQLYRIAVSPSSLPIERYIANFFYDVPVPTPLYPIVRFTMGHEKLSIRLQQKLGLPHQHVSLIPLFKCLSVANIIAVFQHVLAEGKLVLVSSSYTLLTPVAEAIRALLYPFKWQCVFIPILPTNLAYTIRAPVPFIVGLHRSFMDEIRVPPEVMQVDLDRNRITQPADDPNAEKQIVPLPFPIREQLEAHLNSFVDVYRPVDEHSNNELDSYTAPLETTDAELASFQELNIRLTFMRVIIRFLGDYRKWCILREEDDDDEVFDLDRLFDRKKFLDSFPPGLVDFARQMTETQGFSDFILNRVSFTTRMEELLFFDYCCALSRDDPNKKKKVEGSTASPSPETAAAAKPALARSNTVAGLETEKKRSLIRSNNRTLTDISQPLDLYRTGSLTIEKIEEFAALTPSISPFLYTPGQEKPYIARSPDETDCPPSLNYQSFPALDLDRFPASAKVLLAEQQAFAAYSVILEKRKSAEKKAAKAAAKLEQGRPQTPGKSTSSASSSSTPIASPIKNRGNLSLDHIPASPKSSHAGSFAFSHTSTALTTTSLQKIVLALYTLLNSLTARTAKSPAEDKRAVQHAACIYEMWFALFVSECEKERARRVEAAEASKFNSSTAASDDPLHAVRDTRDDAFSPISSVVHIIPVSELPLTFSDLLSIYTELHTQVYKGSVLPNEAILQDISQFCLRAGLAKEFQEMYRLLSTSVPFPGVDFFVTLAKVGVSVLPGHPCSPAGLAEKWREEKALNGKEFEFPTALETQCVCPKCSYVFSGEEVMAGWEMSDRLQSNCPLCETPSNPHLLVTHGDKAASKFDFLKPSQLHPTIHSMTALDHHAKDPVAVEGVSGEEVQDLGDSGSIDLFGGPAQASVSSHDYLRTIKANEFLFWNVFWYFSTRGVQSDDYGQLPFHFLFGEPANSPTWEQPRYVFSARPYRPWRVYQEGSAGLDEVSNVASSLPSRSVSPTLFSTTHSVAGEEDGGAVAGSSAPSSANASPHINGHRGSENGSATDDLGLTAELNEAAEDFVNSSSSSSSSAAQEAMSPLSLTSRSLSLIVAADAESSTTSANPSAAASKPSGTHDPASSAAAPSLISMSTSSISSRRDIRTWAGIVSIMRTPEVPGKQRPVPRAVHEILRARKARRGWTKEQKEADVDSASFSASMYRQLSLLLPDPTDPVGFAAEYRGAITSLNQLIENYRQKVTDLDARMALLVKNATAASPVTPTNVSGGSPPVTPSALKSPTGAATASFDLTATNMSRSPSQSASLSSLLSPSSSGPALPPNVLLNPEVQAQVDANRKQRSNQIATLQEALSLRSEISPLDSPPLDKVVSLIPIIRRLFAHDPTASAKKSIAAASPGSPEHHNAYASLEEDVLLNEVPALEDVLSQSSQNPYYQLDGFTKYCAKFQTKDEKEAERWRLLKEAAAATSTSAPASPAGTSSRAPKPALSLAYKYCAFWQTARRWKIGYEKQEKQRSISMAMKKDLQDISPDVLYDTAKAIYFEYLEPAQSAAAAQAAKAAAMAAPAAAPQAQSPVPADTTATPAPATAADAPAADGAAAAVTTSTTTSPAAAAEAPAAAPAPKAKAPLRPVTTVAGFVIDGAAFAALSAALGDVHSSPAPGSKPSTPTGSSAPSISPTSAATASSTKASIASTLTKRRVPKTLFDDVLAIAQRWLQETVFDSWVEEVKESEHTLVAAQPSIGMTGLHQHGAGGATPAAGGTKMQAQGSAGQGKPPFSKAQSVTVQKAGKAAAGKK